MLEPQPMPSKSRDVLAPRPTGGVARYRIYEDFNPPLVVDSDRAYIEVRYLATFNPTYLWATRMFMFLSSAIFIGGFVSLIWWPWWVPLLGLFISTALYRGTKLSCADSVRDIVISNPEAIPLLVQAAVIRPDMPPNPMAA
jgi:hypothetical protein